MADLPTGTVTFLFTDIEGSTRLWEQHPQAMAGALARHDAIMRQVIAAEAGVVYKVIGDAFQAVFTTAPAACAAALAAQRALASEAWGVVGAVPVRMALHTCAAVPEDGDYRTGALNRLGRLMGAVHGGQIVLSRATADLARDTLPLGAALRDLGERNLRDLRPESIFQLVAPDLPSDFPALKTLDRPAHNLPVPATPLIGREQVITTVCARLRRTDVRLVTLTGPGGMGKTRLGLQVAAELRDDFVNSVYFVNLAPLSDPNLVASTIAQTLEVREAGGQPLIECLNAYLHGKHLLLVLDNFEQVVAAAPLIGALLAIAPHLKALVTSREPLHLTGEHEYAVPPLRLPDSHHLPPLDHLVEYAAVQLFLARAQAVKADFVVTRESAPAIVTICTRLDGLPLAIELAAARVKLLPPHALLARLDQRLQLLTGGARDLPVRQQTIRATIAWSYDLLSPNEQALFRRLGVFVGGFAAEAAEAVGNADHDLTLDVLDGLAALVDKSLLKQAEGAAGEPRFTMLETIRAYALEQLEASGEIEVLRRRHAESFLTLAETAEPQLHRPEQRVWLDRIEVEHDNLRAALEWSLEGPRVGAQSPSDNLRSAIGVRLAAALWWFWHLRGYLPEARRWLDHTLAADRGSATPGRVKALVGASTLAISVSDLELAYALGEQGLVLARQQEDTQGIAWSLWALGSAATDQNDLAPARPLFAESLALLRAVGDRWGQYVVLSKLGYLARRQGDDSEATTIYTESLALARAMGDTYGVASALGDLGSMMQALGDHAQAAALLEESLARLQELGEKESINWIRFSLGNSARQQGNNACAITYFTESLAWFRETGERLGIAACLEGIAQVAIATAQPVSAVRLFGAATIIRDALGNPPYPDEQHEYDRLLTAVREQLGEEVFATAWAAGRAMPPEQAVAEAQRIPLEVPTAQPGAEVPDQTTQSAHAAPDRLDTLTPRERQVLTLITQGASNRAIADALTIAERTAEIHVSNILGKLGVTSRTQAAAYAVAHGVAPPGA